MGDGRRAGGDVFVVNVKFCQNATWQGTVSWNGNNEQVNFRSTLELLKIMDGVVEETNPPEPPEENKP